MCYAAAALILGLVSLITVEILWTLLELYYYKYYVAFVS